MLDVNSFELITFAQNEDALRAAIKENIDSIIFEDERVSSRLFSKDKINCDFDSIKELALLARKLSPKINIYFNLDLLFHEYHFPLIESLVVALNEANIFTIRVQDIGLIEYFSSKFPEFKIQFAPQTGFLNSESIKFLMNNYFSGSIERILLGNELAIDEIENISSEVSLEFEFQVHGNVLLQYSNRRLISAVQGDSINSPLKFFLAEDESRKSLFFPVYESRHGNFFFHHSQKCLLAEIPFLLKAKVKSFLIDLRGHPLDYLSETIAIYKQEIEFYIKTKKNWILSKSSKDYQERNKKFSFTKCFFFKEKIELDGEISSEPQDFVPIGRVLDLIKLKSTVIEIFAPIKQGDTIVIKNPYGKVIKHKIFSIKNILGKSFNEEFETVGIKKLPWIKGALPESTVFLGSLFESVSTDKVID